MRINKYLAHRGFSTRRGADVLIESGHVFVNGVKAVIGQKVSESDTVEIRNAPEKLYRYILYYKPRGVITHSGEGSEADIVSRLQADHGVTDVFPIGRLDKDSEGLMLLTDDGRVTERLLSPTMGHEKEYRVTVDKKVLGVFLKKLENGVNIEGYVTKPAVAKFIRGSDTVFTITLTEGKKHQVRRMCAALGYQVKALTRTRIVNLTLGDLKKGGYRELTKTERDRFLRSLSLK